MPRQLPRWDVCIFLLSFTTIQSCSSNFEQTQSPAKIQIASEQIEIIKAYLDAGEIRNANAAIEEFLKEHSDDPRTVDVLKTKESIGRIVAQGFRALEKAITSASKTKSYSKAWEDLYRFLEIAPTHTEALALKVKLQKTAHKEATDLFLKAQTYESKSRLAAEQYYRRSLDAADPRSELAIAAAQGIQRTKKRSLD